MVAHVQVLDQMDLDAGYALWPANRLEYSAVGLDVGYWDGEQGGGELGPGMFGAVGCRLAVFSQHKGSSSSASSLGDERALPSLQAATTGWA